MARLLRMGGGTAIDIFSYFLPGNISCRVSSVRLFVQEITRSCVQQKATMVIYTTIFIALYFSSVDSCRGWNGLL